LTKIVAWNDELKERFYGDPDLQAHSLFLEDHPDYPSYLLVNSFDPLYAHTLKDVIGEFRAVHKLDLEKLTKAADEYGYNPLIYTKDPQTLQEILIRLNDPLGFDLNVTLYPFQLRGFNYMKDLPRSICNWQTGTGKSVWAVTWVKYLLHTDQIDKVVVLSKAHNKFNWVNQFDKIGSLEALTDEVSAGGFAGEDLTSAQKKRKNREKLYQENQIIVLNYEKLKFRPREEKDRYLAGRKLPSSSGDGQELAAALKGQRVAWILDEAPTKLKSMSTGWYKGLNQLLKMTKESRITVLTATKLEKNPEDLYSWVKLLDKTIWPSKAVFRSMYAKRMFDWRVMSWDVEKLPEIGMRLAHLISKADKYLDPEIRTQFPEFHHEDILVDLYPSERKVYDAIRDKVRGQDTLTLASLTPLQIATNNMSYLERSSSEIAKDVFNQFKPTDTHIAKLEKLRDLIDEIPGKIVIFSAFNELGSQMLASYLRSWGYTFVLYGGSAIQKQQAQDSFTKNLGIRIFLSSDQGSDSINLQEASSVIHYDLPWNSSTFVQRQNRIHRITSEHSHVYSYSLIAAGTLEQKKLAMIERKRKMEEAVDIELDLQAELFDNWNLEDLKEFL
jgi:SNF2 family DNA or RNA helicase